MKKVRRLAREMNERGKVVLHGGMWYKNSAVGRPRGEKERRIQVGKASVRVRRYAGEWIRMTMAMIMKEKKYS